MTKSRPMASDLLEDFPTMRRSVQPTSTPLKPRPIVLSAADEEEKYSDEAIYSCQPPRVCAFIYYPLNRRGSACDSVSSSVTCSFVSHLGGSITGALTDCMNQGMSPGMNTLLESSLTNRENPVMQPGFARGGVPRRGSVGFGGNANGMRMPRRGSSGSGGRAPGPMTRRGSAGYGRSCGCGTILAGRRSSAGGLDHITNDPFDSLDGLDHLGDIDESESLLTSANVSQLDMETFEKIAKERYFVRDSMSMNQARGVPKIISEENDIGFDGVNMESFTTDDVTLPWFPRDSVDLIKEQGALKRIDQQVNEQIPRLIKNVEGVQINGSSIETVIENSMQSFPRDGVSLYHSNGVSKSNRKQLAQGTQELLETVPKMTQPTRPSMMQARNRRGKRRGYTE
mmetsp:Transcript_24225/g.48532  ORF Transcript_24225/g.48532 Transcript_24225/m.48532 type:complete len:398 (-) Transcript_24225:296-1489(-)